jgi:hypothetical protein
MTRRHVHPENAILERATKLAILPTILLCVSLVWLIQTYGPQPKFNCKREVRKLQPLQVERLTGQQFFSYRSAYEWCASHPRSITEPAIKSAAVTPISH